MPADLHCHTSLSDGSVRPEDLLHLAKRCSLDTIAVTDHDTLAGIGQTRSYGKKIGINVIPGAEFSCFDYKRGRKVHLLAYMFERADMLEELCRQTGEERRKASLQMLQKIIELYPVNAEMVDRYASDSTNIFKQHIMHALMDAGYTNAVFGDLFYSLLSSGQGTCNVEVIYPDVFDVLKQLKSARAITVLAHPSTYKSMELLPELIPFGLDGVEVWHPRNRPEDIESLLKTARDNNLLCTGGTDFHGMYSATPRPLGSFLTPEECLAAMFERKAGQATAYSE